jgi:hypothetical protein
MHVAHAIWVVLLGNVGGLLATYGARGTGENRKEQAKAKNDHE